MSSPLASAEKPSGSAIFRPTDRCVCTPGAVDPRRPPRASSIRPKPTAYRSRHPRAWKQFKPVLEETLGTTITDTDTPLPMVELRLA